ncbi:MULTISPECIES: hypothetical protein [Lysinibacillus]|nr:MULTISPECIES: hypothetical protein [Lysinibacillus]UUV23828.1 hypothetical protein NP781_18770 [Lysinibacillus sp. FN11]UYB46700.1 hypothetical protein OCI51_21380 [Lysinibacillus capsici]
MSKIEMAEDKIISTVEGNGHKSEVTITASAITFEVSGATKITLVGDQSC